VTLAVALAAVILAWAAFTIPLIDLAGWLRGVHGSAPCAHSGARGLGRRRRLACCCHVLFSHSFLVRSAFPARLYGPPRDKEHHPASPVFLYFIKLI
jgi:hypothetical protein